MRGASKDKMYKKDREKRRGTEEKDDKEGKVVKQEKAESDKGKEEKRVRCEKIKKSKEREVREKIKEMRKELAMWKEEYEAKTKMLQERIIMAEKFIVEQRELNRRKEESERECEKKWKDMQSEKGSSTSRDEENTCTSISSRYNSRKV